MVEWEDELGKDEWEDELELRIGWSDERMN